MTLTAARLPARTRRVPHAAIVIALCASYALYCLVRMPSGPFTAPDSAGYLGFAPIHTLGYPTFLRGVGVKGALVAQPVLYAIALACLGLEALSLTSSLVLAIAVVVASMAVPELTVYHASLLSESLFMSGLVMFLAAMVRFVRQPSAKAAAGAAVIAALVATVRRTGLALAPVLVVMVWLAWPRLRTRRVPILAAATVPMLALLAGERIAARAMHGEAVTSLMGRHLYAKAALLDAPPPRHASPDPTRRALEDHLDVAFAPIRGLIRSAPPEIRGVLTVYYETCLQGPCVPELADTIPWAGAEMNDALAAVGLDRLTRAPLGYVALTATHYASIWSAYKLRDPVTVPVLNAFIASHRPLPFEHRAFGLQPGDTLVFAPDPLVRMVQPLVSAMGWATFGLALAGLSAAAARRALPPSFAVAALASLTAHAGVLFSVMLAAGLSRFIVSLWPAITTALLFAAFGIVDVSRRWRRHLQRLPHEGQGPPDDGARAVAVV